jgi:hypothetical protein
VASRFPLRRGVERRLPIAALIALGAVGACYADLDGFTGGSGSAADASSPEGAAADDARADTSVDPSAGRACNDAGWLCDDFDRSASIAPAWSVAIAAGGAVVEALDPATPSPPNSLAIRLQSGASGPNILTQTYRASSAGVRCSFAFRIPESSAEVATLFRIELREGTGSAGTYTLDLTANTNDKKVLVTETVSYATGGGAGTAPYGLSTPLLPGWNTVQIALRSGQDGGVGTASMNGLDTALSQMHAPSDRYGQFAVRLVVSSTTRVSQRWTVLYDNIGCDPF